MSILRPRWTVPIDSEQERAFAVVSRRRSFLLVRDVLTCVTLREMRISSPIRVISANGMPKNKP